LIQNPTVSYRSAFAGGGYKSKNACALIVNVPPKEELRIKILLQAERPACPMGLLLKCAGQHSFKQLIQGTNLDLILLWKMSVVGSDDVKDGDCEHGKVTQRPPISYAQFKYPKWITEPDSIKVRLPKGDQFTCDLMNNASNMETYLKWIQVYISVLNKKDLHAPHNVATVDQKNLLVDMKKFLKVPKRETAENKVRRELEVAATKVKLAEATAIQAIAIQACYDLFRQLLADDPRDQWDHIVREVNETGPWTELDATKVRGLQMKTSESLEDCITFHKRTVFSVDAVEWQKSYMMGSLKKPHRMTIKNMCPVAKR
jgi:hypothetical protein